MARKESVTKEMIFDTAFEMLREEGRESITARKLANRIGCSTQPLFRVYSNMEELNEDLFTRAMKYFDEYYLNYPKEYETPFVNLGLAYISFAEKENHLFQLLFLSKDRMNRELYELLNGESGSVKIEIVKAAKQGCKAPSGLFMKMWIFIHGAACMSITGDYDLGQKETVKLLEDCYRAFEN